MHCVQDLSSLKSLRLTILREKRYLSQNLTNLEAEQKEVKSLLEAKNSASKITEVEIKSERDRIAKLVEKAKSLKDLIAQIDRDKKAKEKTQTQKQKVVARATRFGRADRTILQGGTACWLIPRKGHGYVNLASLTVMVALPREFPSQRGEKLRLLRPVTAGLFMPDPLEVTASYWSLMPARGIMYCWLEWKTSML